MTDPSHNKSARRSFKTGCLLLSAVLGTLLACLSLGVISSTSITGVWDGFFPPGEFRLKIRNENGDPIQGAVLQVLDRHAKNLSFQYPIDNYLSENSLISNEQGMITALHLPQGFEFGGSCWKLFWVYPMCSKAPKYYFQISADGYKTIKFSTDEFFAPARKDVDNGTTSVKLENGEALEMSVYELLFVLEQQ